MAIAMAPERATHNLRKKAALIMLDRAVRDGNLSCQVFANGMTVEVGDSDYEPDVVVRCGGDTALPGESLSVPDPLIIVEILSPNTSGIDRGVKLRDYFKLPSLHHYLVVWPEVRRIVRHSRTPGGDVIPEIFTSGRITLDPPGIVMEFQDFYTD
jgi:Uma2 family endonuclease